jgi:hypothetical protein
MNEWNNKQDRVMGRFHHDRGEHPYTQGCVFTPYGIVAVYYQPRDERNQAYATLSIVLGGRHYNRLLHRDLTERGLVTVAHRFAREKTHA